MNIVTQVQKATIYRDSARVTRCTKVDLNEGRTLLEIGGLPVDLVIDSVKIHAHGVPGAKLEGFSSKPVFLEKVTNLEIQKLMAEVDQLNQLVLAQQSRIAAVNARIDHLDNLFKETRSFAFGLTNQKLTINQHFETIEAIATEREKALTERSKFQLGLIDLQNQLAARKKELEQLKSQQETAAYQIDLPVIMAEAGTLSVELSYLQPDCFWVPAYDFSLLDGKLEILYTASVSQQSGENWQDIDLELSTAVPRGYSDLPELQPWYLQKFTPPVPSPLPRARQDRMMKSENLDAYEAMPTALAPMQASYDEAEIDNLGMTTRFTLTQKVSLPSQPSPSRFTISNITLDVEEDRLTIPRLSEEVYRRVKLTNTSDLVFLAGSASLYADEAFIGAVTIPYIPQGAEYLLNFGADERIEVKREIIKQSAAGKFLQDKRVKSYGYQISINNPTPETVAIVLQDQLPVSQHEDIKVRLEKTEPNPDQKDDLNRMTWKLTLPPKSKKLVQFHFVIEAPTDMQIRGLPWD